MRFLVFLFWLVSTFSTNSFGSDYVLGPGDQISIVVYDEPDLSTNVKINKTGFISFPFLDDIKVIGLTPKKLENVIKQGLLGDYLINPQVTVSIVQYRPFFIHGQVMRPGGYPYQDDLTLDKAIALAGGLGNRASKTEWKITRIVDGKSVIITGSVMTLVYPDDIIEIEQSFF
ncbi:polysaccharide biosynthesis/export family protein [Colwellia sp. 1_MG-2023]|uniref:polysaccharide biosynthesis/export family protein n=1 Tax=Colwellia sp. 1_MG-2023 TaxID=3062649 RepID=UPI0026E289CB|nr:polysaccharide biosynthesis/export family protein [Colwellia sp. 1_MG-2023]MDO6445522.1 polysaccharide biosynthesis/export family protein [Colwellia sp. 1_MG-2023]